MKLIVGLGNPGKRYAKNRHNVGFFVVDLLVKQIVDSQWSIDKKSNSLIINHQPLAIFCKPQTMMNDSGKSVSALTAYYKLHTTDLYVVHDDLDIKLGEYKIQLGKGPKDHKGLLSIYDKLGTKDFWHVRVGVDNSVSRIAYNISRITGEDYVLQDFTDEEKDIIQATVAKIVKEIMKDIVIDNLR